jgi:hypothetical protein
MSILQDKHCWHATRASQSISGGLLEDCSDSGVRGVCGQGEDRLGSRWVKGMAMTRAALGGGKRSGHGRVPCSQWGREIQNHLDVVKERGHSGSRDAVAEEIELRYGKQTPTSPG